MDEREMLVLMIIEEATIQITRSPLYQLLVSWDAEKTNADLLSGKPSLPEHAEQAVIDGVNISLIAMREIIQGMQEKYSEERVKKLLDIDKIIEEWK